jgi:hypothetical protein
MRAGMDKNMGHEYNKDVESRYRENYRPTIPTPWPIMNETIDIFNICVKLLIEQIN